MELRRFNGEMRQTKQLNCNLVFKMSSFSEYCTYRWDHLRRLSWQHRRRHHHDYYHSPLPLLLHWLNHYLPFGGSQPEKVKRRAKSTIMCFLKASVVLKITNLFHEFFHPATDDRRLFLQSSSSPYSRTNPSPESRCQLVSFLSSTSFRSKQQALSVPENDGFRGGWRRRRTLITKKFLRRLSVKEGMGELLTVPEQLSSPVRSFVFFHFPMNVGMMNEPANLYGIKKKNGRMIQVELEDS